MKNKTKGTIQDKKSRFFWRFMPMLYHKAIMIKKAAAQFLLLFVMLGTASAASAAGGVAAGLSPERAYGKAGDEITIFLRFNNQSGRDIFAMDFRLSFDASVLRHRDTVLTTQNKDHWDFSFGPGPNYVHAGYDETTVSYPIKASETEIAAITFEALRDGQSEVAVTGLALYDRDGKAIPAGGEAKAVVSVGAALSAGSTGAAGEEDSSRPGAATLPAGQAPSTGSAPEGSAATVGTATTDTSGLATAAGETAPGESLSDSPRPEEETPAKEPGSGSAWWWILPAAILLCAGVACAVWFAVKKRKR